MNFSDALDLLKKYGKYEIAERECKQKGYSHSGDLIKCCEIYCRHFDDVIVRLKREKGKIMQIPCKKWDEIPENLKYYNKTCYIVFESASREFCKKHCKYSLEYIYPKIEEIDQIYEAKSVLKKEAENDFYLR